jgi:Chaperone of endosialidase
MQVNSANHVNEAKENSDLLKQSAFPTRIYLMKNPNTVTKMEAGTLRWPTNFETIRQRAACRCGSRVGLAELALLAFACFTFLPVARAVNPPPDGGYPNFTTAEGQNALKNLTAGVANTAVGWHSLFTDTTGSFNTGVGAGTLVLNTGDDNTATGVAALLLNTTGADNTANGTAALVSNSSGGNNTAVGSFALNSNSTAFNNTAVGAGALRSNTTGQSNTATGVGALVSNTDGGGNTATGALALSANTGDLNTATGLATLQNNTTGEHNTAIGAGALDSNTVANGNTAVGFSTLSDNTFGNENTAIGDGALASNVDGVGNVALGVDAGGSITSGVGNVMLGPQTGASVSTASNVICIGLNVPGADVSNTTWISNVYGTTTIAGTTAPVIVASNGQLGTMSSSRRFKKEIKPMDKASDAILALKPVTFHYKNDAKDTPQFGLIAEEVANVNPDLVVRDKNGDIYSVRYDAVNAMLLNEFLKEHRLVQQQGATIAQQQKQIEALAASLQKVNTQLEVTRPARQVAASNR